MVGREMAVSCVAGFGGSNSSSNGAAPLFPLDLLFIGSSLMLILVAFQMLRDLFKKEESDGLSAGEPNRAIMPFLMAATALMFTLNVISAYTAFLGVELAVGGVAFIRFANFTAASCFWLAIRAWWKQRTQSDFC